MIAPIRVTEEAGFLASILWQHQLAAVRAAPKCDPDPWPAKTVNLDAIALLKSCNGKGKFIIDASSVLSE